MTISPTELVHDVYLKISRENAFPVQGQRHFFFMACRAMRDLLAENARKKASSKRGGGLRRVDLDNTIIEIAQPEVDVLALDQALEKLKLESPPQASVVELRYFGGLTVTETSQILGCSKATVKRRWSYALAWLKRELSTSQSETL